MSSETFTTSVFDQFRGQSRFCAWKLEREDGKSLKVPYVRRDGRIDRANGEIDPSGGMLLDDARELASGWGMEGLGIRLGPIGDTCLVGVDYDTCKAGDQVLDWASNAIQMVDSYTEVSPSGTGFKQFFIISTALVSELGELLNLGTEPTVNRRSRRFVKAGSGWLHPPAIELFVDRRFFTITNQVYGEYSKIRRLSDRQARDIFEKFLVNGTLLTVGDIGFKIGEALRESPYHIKRWLLGAVITPGYPTPGNDVTRSVYCFYLSRGIALYNRWKGFEVFSHDDGWEFLKARTSYTDGRNGGKRQWDADWKKAVEWAGRVEMNSSLDGLDPELAKVLHEAGQLCLRDRTEQVAIIATSHSVEEEFVTEKLAAVARFWRSARVYEKCDSVEKITEMVVAAVGKILRYNSRMDKLELLGCPPWRSQFSGGDWSRSDDVQLRMEIERQGVEVTEAIVSAALIGLLDSISVDPIKEAFERLAWDRRPRLGTAMATYFGVEHGIYPAEGFTKWMVGLVQRTYEPGSQMDLMPIFLGPEGVHKSTFGRIMATFDGVEYFSDLLVGNDRDKAFDMTWPLIREWSEVDKDIRIDFSGLKAEVTKRHFQGRLAYGRGPVSVPRKGGMYGTSNLEKLLPPGDEHRRFLPFRITRIDLVSISRDRDQLWAEAVQLYKGGMKPVLSDAAVEEARAVRVAAQVEDEWKETIVSFLLRDRTVLGGEKFGWDHEPLQAVYTEELFEALGVGITDRKRNSSNRLTAILKQLGYVATDGTGRFSPAVPGQDPSKFGKPGVGGPTLSRVVEKKVVWWVLTNSQLIRGYCQEAG